MKYLKILIISAISVFALFSMEKTFKPMFGEYAEKQALEYVDANLLIQKDVILKGVAEKQSKLDNIAAAIGDKEDADLISGILEGNLSHFLWLEYSDRSGIPKAIAGQRSDTYTISSPAARQSRVEAGISLTALAETSMQDNIMITSSPDAIVSRLSADGNTVAASIPLDNEGNHLIVAKDIPNAAGILYLIEAAVVVLALYGLLAALKLSRHVDIPSITSFFEQIERGNTELRFDLRNSDQLHTVKHSINVFLDESQKMLRQYKHERSQLVSFNHTISSILREQTLLKDYQYFISFMLNELEISDLHIFLKNNEKIVHFHNQKTNNLSFDENMEKLFSFKEKAIMDEFDLSSIISNYESGIHSHIMYPLDANAVLLLPKSSVSHIKLDIFEIFVRIFREAMNLHNDRLSSLRSKVRTEKSLSGLSVAVIRTSDDGKTLLSNEAGKAILPPESGSTIFETLRSLNTDIDELRTVVASGKTFISRVDIAGRAALVSASRVAFSEYEPAELIFAFTDISDIYNELTMKTREYNRTITVMEDRINRLSTESAELHSALDEHQRKASGLGDASPDALCESVEGLTVHMAASLSRSAKILRVLTDQLFDDDEKKMVAMVKKELTSMNFLLRDMLMIRKEPDISPDFGDINEVIKKSFDLAKAELKNRKCALTADMRKDLPDIRFDRTIMSLTIYNIFTLAAQYCRENSSLRMASTMEGDEYVFSLSVSPYAKDAARPGASAKTLAELISAAVAAHGGRFESTAGPEERSFVMRLAQDGD